MNNGSASFIDRIGGTQDPVARIAGTGPFSLADRGVALFALVLVLALIRRGSPPGSAGD